MSLAHLTLPTQHVAQTAAFLEDTLGYVRDPVPSTAPALPCPEQSETSAMQHE